MDILDPVTGESVHLGDSGFAPRTWNEARTTFITVIGGWEVNNYFAVYSVEADRALFRGELDASGLVFWIEDPAYVLYEVGDYTLHYSSEYHTLFLHENVQTEAVSIQFGHFDANRSHFYSDFGH